MDSSNFNKIIMNRLITYNKKFTNKELENILIELRNIDLKIKSTSINHKLLFSYFFQIYVKVFMYNFKKTDEELIVQFQQGNIGAFNELVQRYKDKLLNYVYYYFNDLDTAEDIVQIRF